MKLNVQQNHIYDQKINYFQKYGLNILSMPYYEIDKVIHEMIESNPIVEYEENPESISYNSKFDINQVPTSISLYDSLIKQMNENSIFYNKELIDVIYMNLDSHGFFSKEKKERLIQLGIKEKDLDTHLLYLKNCSPQGIGCLDIIDFMCFQLSDDTKINKIARAIITEHFDLLKYNLLEEIARRCECTVSCIQEAFFVLKECDKFPVVKNKDFNDLVEVSLSYDQMWIIKIRQPRYAIKASSFCSCYELQSYAKNFIDEVNRINRALEMRNKTIERIIKHILEHNQDFFLNCKELKPVTMTQCSNDLHLHKSTISRAISNKFLEYQGNVYPIKNFFSRDTLSSGKNDDEVKRLIYKIFQSENHTLKDQEVCEILKSEYKIIMSRRTVSKYRNNLGIDGYYRRKRVKGNER